MDVTKQIFAAVTRMAPSEAGRERMRITTAAPDRAGDIVMPDGCQMESYMKNPVVMWLHDYQGMTPAAGIPIGRTLALTVDADGIVADFQFLQGDPFAARVENAWRQDMLRTASIGFRPLRAEPLKGAGGLRYLEWELLEWSLVPIPMNSGALREEAIARMVKAAGMADLVLPVDAHEGETVRRAQYESINEALQALERRLLAKEK